MVWIFRIVIFLLVLAGRAFAEDDSGKVWWYRIIRSSNPFHDSGPPCLVRGQSATKRDDYTYTRGIGGHKLHSRAMTWNQARITCDEEGGHLAIINSIAEANVITEILKNGAAITDSPYPDHASVGYHDLFDEGQFVTIHGQTLARAGFSQWAQGEPNNVNGGEDCAALSKNGELFDIKCDIKFGFICEIPIY